MTGEPYRDDANDPHALRLEADHTALEDHTTTSAQLAHRIIATHLWTMLRDLGFTEGRVLAVGDDAATFIGLPHTDGSSPASVSRTSPMPTSRAPSSWCSCGSRRRTTGSTS